MQNISFSEGLSPCSCVAIWVAAALELNLLQEIDTPSHISVDNFRQRLSLALFSSMAFRQRYRRSENTSDLGRWASRRTYYVLQDWPVDLVEAVSSFNVTLSNEPIVMSVLHGPPFVSSSSRRGILSSANAAVVAAKDFRDVHGSLDFFHVAGFLVFHKPHHHSRSARIMGLGSSLRTI